MDNYKQEKLQLKNTLALKLKHCLSIRLQKNIKYCYIPSMIDTISGFIDIFVAKYKDMQVQIEQDKRLVENLISSKKPDALIRKYQTLIYNVMDKQIHEFDSHGAITAIQKKKMMMDFIDNLLSNEAKLLKNYLRPQNHKGHQDNTVEVELPMLSSWLYLQCVNYFSARCIVDGILSKNINVIKTFFFSKKRPGCREIFSKWIFENGVFMGSNDNLQKFIDDTIAEYVNILYADIDRYLDDIREINEGKRKKRRNQKDYEKAELTSLASFRFEVDFYSYFRDYVVHPYLRRKFFPKPIINSIDDDGDNEIGFRKPEISMPTDSSRIYDARDFLERIFQIMERTKAGKRQVKVLKLLDLENYDGETPSEEEIAKMLNISISNLRVIHSRGLDTAREIAKILEMKD